MPARKVKAIVIALFFILPNTTFSQSFSPKLDWWGDIPGFLNEQAAYSLQSSREMLTKYPPQLPEPKERRIALLALDNVLHEADAPSFPAVQQHLKDQISNATTAIENTEVDQGAMIWKLYNHGFVVRTATVTFAYDLVRAQGVKTEGFAIPDATMQQIIDQCDALFVSHYHRDHADEWVAEQFIKAGKPVVAPPDIWKSLPFHDKVQHLERSASEVHDLTLKNQEHLKVTALPGHQGKDILNNVSLVTTPEGLTFCQTGDQSNDTDFSWIDKVGENNQVDVIFPNCWTTDIVRLAKGFDPQLIITGHENEMGHTVDHREAYWLTYVRLEKSAYPLVLMTWGEQFHYIPEKF